MPLTLETPYPPSTMHGENMSTQNDQPERPRNKEEEKEDDSWLIAGMAVPGGLLFGMGVGFLTEQLVAGLFMGLGAGFILTMLIYIWLQRGKTSR